MSFVPFHDPHDPPRDALGGGCEEAEQPGSKHANSNNGGAKGKRKKIVANGVSPLKVNIME